MYRLSPLLELVLRKHFIAALIASTLLGAILCFVPLFDLIGYESSLVLGVFVQLATLVCTLRVLQGTHLNRKSSDRAHHGARDPVHYSPRHSEAPPWAMFDLFFLLFVRHVLLLVPPAILLSLNALRIPNCDFWQGFGFWLLGPPFAILTGQMAAWIGHALLPDRRRLQYVVAFAILLANALSLGLHILFEPPINGHQWAIGYLNGSIYDEAIQIPAGLLWYRIANFVLVLAVVCGIEWWRVRSRAPGHHALRGLFGLALVSIVIWCGMTATEQRFGIRVDRDMIAEELGGRVETEHFIIYFPDHRDYREQLDLIKEDHEFRYAEMKAYFKTDPVALHGEKVKSFIYPNTDVKGHLMGARRTLIAKIWLREIHIMWRGHGTHLLAHELAHVFTEPFASGPLKLSMQNGVGVNMGLVEGIATAADAPPLELSLHESSAAMREVGLAPDIRGLVGATGFWTQASGRAYTLMGSFVKFLVDTYGIETFKKVYGNGDFQSAYGKSTNTLVTEWEQMLDGIELDAIQLDITRYRYERPSIFGKVCARTIAELKRVASDYATQGQLERARAIYDQIIDHDPLRTSHRLGLAKLLLQANEDDEALEVLDELIAQHGEELVPAQLAQVNEMRGDVLWRGKNYNEAQRMYASCLDVGVLDDERRMLLAKFASLEPERAPYREIAREYLLDSIGDSVALYYPTRWRYEQPTDPLVAYMVGRRLWAARRWADAREHLVLAVETLGEGLLQAEAMLMLGQVDTHLGSYALADQMFSRLAKVRWSRLQGEAEEWRARVAFKQGRLK